MAAKKKEEKTQQIEEELTPDQRLSKLVLDRKFGKYEIVDRISHWAKELRRMEEHRHLTQTEILELAMSEVLSGKVSEDMLEKELKKVLANGAAKKNDKKSVKKP